MLLATCGLRLYLGTLGTCSRTPSLYIRIWLGRRAGKPYTRGSMHISHDKAGKHEDAHTYARSKS